MSKMPNGYIGRARRSQSLELCCLHPTMGACSLGPVGAMGGDRARNRGPWLCPLSSTARVRETNEVFVFLVLGIELRALHLQGRRQNHLGKSPTPWNEVFDGHLSILEPKRASWS